jgi:hypothetical protein
MGACVIITPNTARYCADLCEGVFLAVWRFFAQPVGRHWRWGLGARRIARKSAGRRRRRARAPRAILLKYVLTMTKLFSPPALRFTSCPRYYRNDSQGAISMRLDDTPPGAKCGARFREMQFTADGLVLGEGTVLAKMNDEGLCVDEERVLTCLAVAFGPKVPPAAIGPLHRAAMRMDGNRVG